MHLMVSNESMLYHLDHSIAFPCRWTVLHNINLLNGAFAISLVGFHCGDDNTSPL